MSGKYEFKKILFEMEFILNDGFEQMKEKLNNETEDSEKEVVADMNQNVDNEKEKLVNWMLERVWVNLNRVWKVSWKQGKRLISSTNKLKMIVWMTKHTMDLFKI